MRSDRCDICGDVTLTGHDLDELVVASLAHFTEVHPELGLTQLSIRNYYEAIDRLTGPTERLPEISEIEIRETSPELLGDILTFFDHDAYVGRPEWAGCYCVHHHLPVGDRDRTWRRNREELERRIRDGNTRGILAYADGRLAGWCNASLRSEFPELAGRDELPDEEVGSIFCFVIAPPYRKHGLAERLLDGACRSYKSLGVRVAEAYPRRSLDATPGWEDAVAFHGPLEMCLRAGFKPVEDNGNLVVVQKKLR